MFHTYSEESRFLERAILGNRLGSLLDVEINRIPRLLVIPSNVVFSKGKEAVHVYEQSSFRSL